MPGRLRDVACALLLLLAAGWTTAATPGALTDKLPFLGALALAALAYGAGRRTGTAEAYGVPGTAVLGLLVGSWVLVATLLTGRASGGLLGYPNASAALAVQCAAAVALLRSSTVPWVHRVGTAGCVALVVAAVSMRSLAGAAGATLVLVAALAPPPTAGLRRLGRALVPAVVVGSVAVPVVVALRFGAGRFAGAPSGVAELSQRRVDLWYDAVGLARENPWHGVGVGNFARFSPTAALDPDTRPAHSMLLEVAAENGLVVAGALAALLVLVLRGASRGHARAASIGAAAGLAFVLHAAVDYVADFPLVVAVAAAVAGGCTATVGSLVGAAPDGVRTAPRRPG